VLWYNTDTVIDNPRISGTHCKIWREFEPAIPDSELNALVKIQDFSTNGTYVRGVKLGKGKITILHHGDEVCFGPKAVKGTNKKDEFRKSRLPSLKSLR
jgi:serine/threonine/tyrosine protein kinase RAD53